MAVKPQVGRKGAELPSGDLSNLRQRSDLLPNSLDNRRNCRLIHMLDRMRKITAILGTALICVTGSVATTFTQTPVPSTLLLPSFCSTGFDSHKRMLEREIKK